MTSEDTPELVPFKLPIISWNHGTLNPEKAKNIRCEILCGMNKEKTIVGIVPSDKEEITYLSKKNDSAYGNEFVIIRNKKTNNIRIVPTDNFLMLPYRNTVDSKNISNIKSEDKAVVKNASFTLSKAMGSKKTKRRVNEIEKSNIQFEDIEKKLKLAIKNNELNVSKEIPSVSGVNEKLVPPCNRAANSVENVYQLHDLMPAEVLDSLEFLANEIIEYKIKDLSQDDRLSDFFKKTFSQTPTLTPLKIKLLLCVDGLIEYLHYPLKILKKKNPVVCGYSARLNEQILKDFAVPMMDGMLSRPQSMRDKTLCYILVLLLLINDFTIDISILSGYLNALEYSKLPRLLKAVGASPDKKSAINYVLKLPLAELSTLWGGRQSIRSKR